MHTSREHGLCAFIALDINYHQTRSLRQHAPTHQRATADSSAVRLVIARTEHRWPWQRSATDRIAALANDLDVVQVALPVASRDRPAAGAVLAATADRGLAGEFSWRGYAAAVVACAATALLATPLLGLLGGGLLGVGAIGEGLGPAVAAEPVLAERAAAEPVATSPAGRAAGLQDFTFDSLHVDYELGRTDDAIAAMRSAIAAGWRGRPDGRCRIAELLMRAGRVAEAAPLWDQVRADTPDDVWLYNNAGLEYADVGDDATALAWLTEGLELALVTGDPEHLVDQLRDLRGAALTRLGRPADRLQERATQFMATPTPTGHRRAPAPRFPSRQRRSPPRHPQPPSPRAPPPPRRRPPYQRFPHQRQTRRPRRPPNPHPLRAPLRRPRRLLSLHPR